jgi:D-alanine-D-alanine ligase
MDIVLIKSYTDKPWRSPETYRMIENSLKENWRVTSISTKSPKTLYRLFARLRRERGGSIFVFNIAEYLDEKNKTGFLPALLDEWNIPHLGSDPETIAIGLDKAKTKEVLFNHQIPTPRYFVADRIDSSIEYNSKRIGYPLIVKPIGEGGHIGIGDDSIVYDDPSLEKAIQRILDIHHQAAIVEEFITGDEIREFSVGIIDSDNCLYTPIEIDYEAMDVEEPILSYEAAQKDLERTKLVQDKRSRDEIIDLSIKTFRAVRAHDYSRVDLRMDHTGYFVLEINIMPGLGPHSFLPEAAKEIHGLEYDELIQKLAIVSMKRQGISGK